MFYNELKNNIIKRCLFVDYNDPSLGGESFETLIDDALQKCKLDSKWKKYSKNSSGYDMCINNEKMSVKTIINNGKNTIRLSSYRLTKCKTFEDFYTEIERRDQYYQKVFLFERNYDNKKCDFIFYEIPTIFFKLSKKCIINEKSISCFLKNNSGSASINYSASNQLCYSFNKDIIEKYKTYSFTINFVDLEEKKRELFDYLNVYIGNINIMSNSYNQYKKPVIISLFDGISCAQLAINNLGVKHYDYYSSEIDKYALQITKKNFPQTKFIGNVLDMDCSTLLNGNKKIYQQPYLLVGGSPCQNLSSRGNKKGLNGEKSSLFFEYIRVLKETQPIYFLLENVGSMSGENKDIITDEIKKVFTGEFQCIKINSKIFVPQNRRRYYWTNIQFKKDELPSQTIQIVHDLLEDKVDDKYYYNEYNKERSFKSDSFNSKPEADLKIARTVKTQSYTGRAAVDNCYHTLYKPENKTNLRKLTPKEYERLQGIPDDYTSNISETQRYKCIGNSFTVPVIKWFFSYIFNKNDESVKECDGIDESVKECDGIDELKKLKIQELKQLCKKRGVKKYCKLKKDELIKLILDYKSLKVYFRIN